MIRPSSLAFLTILALFTLANPAKSADQAQAIEPEVAKIFRQMSDYLGSLQQFTFRG